MDAYLSRKAKKDLDPRALVIERVDGSWIVSVPGLTPSALGDSFGDARGALAAMIKA